MSSSKSHLFMFISCMCSLLLEVNAAAVEIDKSANNFHKKGDLVFVHVVCTFELILVWYTVKYNDLRTNLKLYIDHGD